MKNKIYLSNERACPICGHLNNSYSNICASCGRILQVNESTPKDYRPIITLIILLTIVTSLSVGVYFYINKKPAENYESKSDVGTYTYNNTGSNREITDNIANSNEENANNNTWTEPVCWGIITSSYSEGIAVHPEPLKDSDVLIRIPYQETFMILYFEPDTSYAYIEYDGVRGYLNLDYADVYYDEVNDDYEVVDYGIYKDGHGIDEYDYVIEDSNSRYLTQEDIDKLTLRGVNYAKNEIYARHGRDFKSTELKEFFASRNWYSVQYALSDESDVRITSEFNSYEKKNNELLNEAEEKMGTYSLK